MKAKESVFYVIKLLPVGHVTLLYNFAVCASNSATALLVCIVQPRFDDVHF